MFDLEQAIKSWKQSLRKSPAFEEGQIQEIETHLRDDIDRFVDEGLTDEKAYQKAVQKMGSVEDLGDEIYKTKTTNKVDATPPWNQSKWATGMIPTHLKIAFRNLKHNKLQSSINIFGLAIGLVCCILIFMFIRREFSYDNFYENSEDLYLVTYQEMNRPGARFFATTSQPMGPKLQQEFPEIKHAIRLIDSQNNVFTYQDEQFYEGNIFYADSSFFEVFSFPFAQGDAQTALDRPNTTVLTQETAQKYFGNENPIGKELIMDGSRPLEVTGVLEPIPETTHLPLSLLISFETFEVPAGYPVTLESWSWVSFHTYLRLEEGTDPDALESKLPGFIQKYRSEEMANSGQLLLKPVSDIYLSKEPRNDVMKYGNTAYAYGLGAIAILILLIAGFNFMNISTAQSLKRGKEAGIRKVLGSNRGALIRQFLGESIIKALVALVLAVILLSMFGSYFSGLLGFELTYNTNVLLLLSASFLMIALLIGLGAGIYPAVTISNYKPGEVLKGSLATSRSSLRLRNGLMTLQFAISIVLIIGSMAISNQISFLQQKELGFDKEQTVAIKVVRDQFEDRYNIIKQQLEQNSNVEQVTAGDLFLGGHGSVPMFPEGFDNEEGYPMNLFGVKYGFYEVMNISMKEGRAFSESIASDSTHGVILNQAAVDILGWENPIGKQFRVDNIVTDGEVIGVTENFHFASLHNRINPLVMFIPRANLENILVKIRPGNLGEAMASLEEDWSAVAPDMPFEFTFLDDSVDQLYRSEQRFATLVFLFTCLSIFIACIGLYGLVSISIQHRIKEIGIRKVLGASMGSIIKVVSKPYLVYVILANLIAWPLAWWALNRWLQEFAYSVSISFWIFILAGVITALIAFLTMGSKAMRVATINPVQSLRSE